MKTLRILLAPALWLALALPSMAAPVSLAEISRYLNSIQSAQTEFTQQNADGSTSAGRLLIKRPGRMRFEYTGDNTLVLASGGQVAIFDSRSNLPPEQYPLSRTPLNLILARNVDLTRAKMVVGHGEVNGMTTVTAQDPARPEVGTITLYFSPSPLRLEQWVVTDETGSQTLVRLGALQPGEFPPSTFLIDSEMGRRK
ncbi:LolA family protein [Frigidibacter mobilis]|uniref:Outer membrane lipoprotein carrier protein LolA n=1 Tax=Frigidibacter mobilis TaxID=1335048 RepID=A0A159Z8K0_9RHOB|nr:outer membrane lipoprotein carrier protein LolA [Frigidibacter mobilis]AMY71866.1 outer membrane lipoprotein carrier protein LolA [Frigidibacter mobilis]